MAARKLYLIMAIVLFLVLFIIVFLPYVVTYVEYLNGHKKFEKGSYVLYEGYFGFYFTKCSPSGQEIEDVVDKDLRYTVLLVNTGEGVRASLRIYDVKTNQLIFSSNRTLSRGSGLVLFFLPANDSVKFFNGLFRLDMCNVAANRFLPGPSFGVPSLLGVPRLYMGMLYIDKALAVIEYPGDWDRNWKEHCKMPSLLWTGVFMEYTKLEKGYMLAAYTAYYGTDMNSNPKHAEDIAKVFKQYGSPLLDLFIKTFDVPILKKILSIGRGKGICVDIVRETAKIVDSNTYPVDQAWLDGVIGAYMSLTPFSQVLTILIVVFVVLYIRKR